MTQHVAPLPENDSDLSSEIIGIAIARAKDGRSPAILALWIPLPPAIWLLWPALALASPAPEFSVDSIKRNKGSEEETPGDESQWTQDYTAEPEEDARRETSLKKKTPRMRGFVVKAGRSRRWRKSELLVVTKAYLQRRCIPRIAFYGWASLDLLPRIPTNEETNRSTRNSPSVKVTGSEKLAEVVWWQVLSSSPVQRRKDDGGGTGSGGVGDGGTQ
ncbi:hypothetical protein AXG93_3544s1040 [Marchantia polymorpha subsp. ruderalis]|uniref:Uncharacterized protein n=1 Tax=Marchantia polymorpha subsp. ruderalis TaxID=1480154 RepID=A0A176VRF2_MARPO|nr:hypothetical protein AXG93_3544s1040 [Marchantia polymorpha subsp. ruderalis]